MSLTDYEVQILDNVEKFGCHVTHVFDPDGEQVCFSYSVGFSKRLATGEVIIFGLGNTLMNQMITVLFDLIASGTVKPSDGLAVPDVLDGHVCVLRSVLPENITPDYFNSAMWFAQTQIGRPLTDAFQLCWPPVGSHLMPWSADCPADVRALQPPLYEKIAA